MIRVFLMFATTCVLNAGYLQMGYKAIQVKPNGVTETFDRTKLIPITPGKHHYATDLPEAPKTLEQIITAGNVNGQNNSFTSADLTADNVIRYLSDSASKDSKNQPLDLYEGNAIEIQSIRRIETR